MNKAKNPLLGQMPVFMGLLTFVLVFFILTRTPVDADMWWHLRAGQEMWKHRTILLTDQFSYTRSGDQWTNAFWLSEISFYLLYRIGGYAAIALFVSFVGGATFLLIHQRLPGNPILNSFIIILSALTAAPIWGPRPQILSFLIIAWLDRWLADQHKNGVRQKWILIPVFALWANLHGGWIWGMLLLLAHISGGFVTLLLTTDVNKKSTLRKETLTLLAWSILASLAVGLNPNGLAIWGLPFQQVDVSMQIQEWLSPDFHRLDFQPLLWMIFLLLLTGQFARKPVPWSGLFKVIGFAYLTFVAQRNIALFAIVAAPLLAEWTHAALQALSNDKVGAQPRALQTRITAAANVLIIVLLSSASLGYLLLKSQPSLVDKPYPVDAIAWIKKEQPAGRLFNSYNWGGYLLWNLPEYPIFIDGRADLYGEEILTQWHQMAQGTEQGLDLLERWEVRLVLLEPYRPLVNILEQRGWQVGYRDAVAVVLTK
jgi:hypothetical protein